MLMSWEALSLRKTVQMQIHYANDVAVVIELCHWPSQFLCIIRPHVKTADQF